MSVVTWSDYQKQKKPMAGLKGPEKSSSSSACRAWQGTMGLRKETAREPVAGMLESRIGVLRITARHWTNGSSLACSSIL